MATTTHTWRFHEGAPLLALAAAWMCVVGCGGAVSAGGTGSTEDASSGGAPGVEGSATGDASGMIAAGSVSGVGNNNGLGGPSAAPGTQTGGGAPGTPPSCAGLASVCGPVGDEECCSSLLVTGGTFYRGYDGINYTDESHPATVSSFRLDRFEVTVGRFRRFVSAWVGGWRPAAGDGRHVHLNGSSGLAATSGGYEPGWDEAWNANLGSDSATWDANLSCSAEYQTWTPNAGRNEQRPLNCVTWYELHAFCIWDGGFLPSDAEWNYAAAGGSEQRQYPWGAVAPTAAYASYECATPVVECLVAVGTKPLGDGKYGQADLAGNVGEWTLDWKVNPFYPTGCNICLPEGACNDCSNLAEGDSSTRMVRGGAFYSGPESMRLSPHGDAEPGTRHMGVSGRCARPL